MKTKLGRSVVAVVVAALIAVSSSHLEAGMNFQGMNFQGMNFQGMNFQGMNFQGMNFQGMNFQGMNFQGMNFQGMNFQGMNFQGMNFQGMNFQGMNFQGMNFQGMNFQGMNFQGTPLTGIDRGRGLGATFTASGISRADVQVPGANLQGLQSGSPITYVEVPNPMAGVRLQASPTDTSDGSFIYVPGVPDLRNSLWNLQLTDASGGTGGIALYIADVQKDTRQNSSKYPSNDDIYLYTVYFRQPATGQWAALCPEDIYGQPHAMAVPLNPQDRSEASRQKIGFACTGSGVAAKCARNWGYKPWKTVNETVWDGAAGFVSKPVDLAPFYDTCLIAARADYCQDGQSFTKNGTLVDLFDTLDGITSINATAGLAYAPYSPLVMLHEEYQVSVAGRVFSPESLMSLPAGEQAALANLHLSGVQSSRYADLDPGRSCLAAPYTDRCDPKEPYACYRATNMGSQAYGAFVAINSPRFCGHDETTPGDPLDPLCNQCVSRVCQIDPTCCGDPGSSFYPGSLVWDSRCSSIRQQVCKSAPGQPVWPAGQVAPVAGSHPVVNLSGAVGSFEGLTTSGGTTFVEGWACDPDFPGASSPVQISVGGALGAAGATLVTATADQPLVAGWSQAVAAACGGAGRHGFRVALPAGTAGKDVYTYGIDLNVPGAPFTLLRGGKKTVPGAVTVNPRAAIWTGWIEPPTDAQAAFSVDAGPADLYRVWVNGTYVAGNWVDADASAPGAFTALPPNPASPPSQSLLRGTRYAVRVEYRRPDPAAAGYASSKLGLSWSLDGAPAVPVPAGTFVPSAQGTGMGLLRAFSEIPGGVGPVNEVWTVDSPPAPGVSVQDAFSARFEGQVVPPISGDYTFTADTDGTASIWVNGQLVTSPSKAPMLDPSSTCSHDICRTGAAVSRTCQQGYFCAAQICLTDPACCSITWDARCLQEVADVCKLTCTPTPPVPITLSAGKKYDIRVEFDHGGGGGAKLRLMWAMGGSPRDVIPTERLFAGGAPSGLGIGVNAAYFSDADFKTEILDRVEPTLAFAAATPPGPGRATTLVCGISGAPACAGGADALGAPGLTAPTGGASLVGPSVSVAGGGVAGGATVELATGTIAADAFVPASTLASFAQAAGGSGTFTRSLTLGVGTHTVAARQLLSGKTSAWSAPLTFEVIAAADPAAPVAPTVNQPPSGLVSGNGTVPVGGRAAPGATVTVSAGAATQTFVADASGLWAGTFVLPGPGAYLLSFTQTSGGHTSAAAPSVAIKVALPPLTLTSPAEGATVATPVTLTGTGAQANLGGVIVGDGDGRFFAERATLSVGAGGAFSGSLSLDYGRHQLKLFQRAGGLDGEGALRTVLVPPPVASPGITSVLWSDVQLGVPTNTPVPPKVTLEGRGTLRRTGTSGTGLRAQIFVYQGTTKIAEGPMADDGFFSIPVTLSGSGAQQISVSQVAYSLSGGGAAEGSRTSSVRLLVVPPAPRILSPISGTVQTPLAVAISGTAVAGASVEISVDGTPKTTTTATAAGTFSANLTLVAGNHRLTAAQTKDGAPSSASATVVVAVGDVTPPTLMAAQAEIVRVATTPEGIAVAYGNNVTAQDGATALPVTCSPESGSIFPYGTTLVSCSARDTTGNVGRTNFRVTVKSTTPPTMPSNQMLTFEATGPAGAIADYRVDASGYVADCSPPGSSTIGPCTVWSPAGKGLGFVPNTVALDPTGALYVASSGDDDPFTTHGASYLRSADHGATWQPFTSPPGANIDPGWGQGSIVAPTASSLFVPGYDGLKGSADGGATWTTTLPGVRLTTLATDAARPGHMVAFARGASEVAAETLDGWATSHAIDAVPGFVQGLALDPVNLGRMYAIGGSTQLYRRDGEGPWERLAVPPYDTQDSYFVPTAAEVAPVADRCVAGQPACQPCAGAPGQLCQIYPTVYLRGLLSRDGGDTWSIAFSVPGSNAGPVITSVLFDRDYATNATVYASSDQSTRVSHDGGRTWATLELGMPGAAKALLQDPVDPNRLYAVVLPLHAGTLLTSTNRGATWAPLTAPDLALAGSQIQDLAVDPVDPRVAYALTWSAGLFKTTDGGESWKPSGRGIPIEDRYEVRRLIISPFERNVVYAGGLSLYRSSDGAANWSRIDYSPGLRASAWAMAFDPQDGALIGASSAQPGASDYSNIFSLSPGGTTPQYFTTFTYRSDASAVVDPFDLQVVPNAQHTIIMSWWESLTDQGVMEFIPGLQARAAGTGSTTFGQATRPPLGAPSYNFTYDRSDGTDRFFTLGGYFQGQYAGIYSSSSIDPLNQVWSRRGNIMDSQFVLTEYSRLLIDARSGGRVMTALGSKSDGYGLGQDARGLLFDSQDGGRNWTPDLSAPSGVAWIWRSPADGALYATAGLGLGIDEARFHQRAGNSSTQQGTLWKRSVARGTPPGARVVVGDVPVSCVGGNGDQAVTPGSTFPIGDSVLACTATDAFGNMTTRNVTIRVRDTTPPAVKAPASLSFDSPIWLFPFVTATDVVDGDVAPNCTPALDGPFDQPLTTVTCTASDSRGNTAVAKFPITIGATGAPILDRPGDITAEATGSDGATVTWNVNARTTSGGTLAATCAPASGSKIPLGTTPVTCSATAAGVTATVAFLVKVVDQTAPALTVPASLAVPAQGGWGATVTYVASAQDAVSGAIAPQCTPASGSAFALGATPVTCRAVDAAGNLAEAGFTVTVSGTPGTPGGPAVDLAPPALTLPDRRVTAQDQTGARVEFSDAFAFDAGDAADAPLDCVPESGSLFPIGVTNVNCTAADSHGNLAIGAFVVTVTDDEAPAVTVPADLTVEATGPTGAPVTFAVSGSDFVSGALAPICTRANSGGWPTSVTSGATLPMGDSTVTCAATDAAGNVGTSSFIVTVRDTTPPVLALPAAITKPAGASGSVTVDFVPSATDLVAGALPVGCTPKSGTFFLVGTTIVACSARDAAGNTALGTFTVSVAPANAPPVVTVPAPLTVEATSGSGAVATFTASATDTQDGARPVTCAPASGSTFALGATPVTCTATDLQGAVGTASFTVTVRDTTPPALTLPAPLTATAGSGGKATVTFSATASDTVSGSLTPSCTPPSGSQFSIGVTAVTCTVQDGAGNPRSGTFNVTVLAPNTPPTVTVPSPLLVEATGPAGAAVVFAATAIDAQDGARPVTCVPASGSVFALGATPVTCTAADTQGATGTASFTVTVRDTTPPVLSLPANITAAAGAGGKATVTFSATAADAVSGVVPVVCAPASGTQFSVGVTTVSCSATDASTNVRAGTFTVTVTATPANTPPVVTVPANIVAEATSSTGAKVTFTATASDAQDGARPVTCTPASGTTFAIGVKTVTCKATDTAGLTGTASFTITVKDAAGPVLSAVPAPINAFATATTGAKVTYTAPKSTDAVDGTRPVTCAPASGSTFPLKATTVTCTASDTHGNQSTATFVVTVTYAAPTDGTFFLAPLRADGTSVFKIGRPVPTRFKLTGASAGITNLVAKFTVTKISDAVQGTSDATSDETDADTGSTFIFRSLLKFYAYRWKTTDQTQGTYLIKADLGDGVAHTIKVSLRR